MAGDFSTSAGLSPEVVFNTFSTGARRHDFFQLKIEN